MDAIETSGLTRVFGDRVAVEDLTLRVPEGTVCGFIGPNGAGKTTTVRLLAGLIAPTRGTATVAGHRLGVEDGAIRRATGILTETPGLYTRLTAAQNLIFFARLHELDARRAGEQCERYLRLLGLWERRDEVVATFSKGMRQKLALARALLHEPSVVFLDEPTANLDPAMARTIRELIRELRDQGRTIFLTTHNLSEVDQLCDSICIFRQRLLRLDSPANLRKELSGRGTVIRFAGEPQAWLPVVLDLPYVNRAVVEGPVLRLVLDDPDERNPLIVERLTAAGARIRYVEPVSPSLEEVYLRWIGDSGAPGEGAEDAG